MIKSLKGSVFMTKLKKIGDKIRSFILAHPELCTISGLLVILYFIFFHNIGNYALMDVDETRYVTMAKDMFASKDFLTLYLNKEFFFEKPPLYFWSECLSFAVFGKINEFTARFPVALYGASCCLLMYFMGHKIVSREFGVISSLMLATSLEFLILGKFAILDIVVSTCIALSICFGMIVYFCRESHKKYYWWLFYIFSALAVLAKGLPGFIVPFGAMLFISLISKRFKEIFKPIYIIPGFILFFAIVLPWHIAMFKMHNPLFWDEYIIKHHVARFLGSKEIDRAQPFYFYFVTLLWGFFPWILSCLAVWIKKLVQFLKLHTLEFDHSKLTETQKYLLYCSIIVGFILLFFSTSETKLVTYILPAFPFLAVLGAFVWQDYIKNSENEKLINITIYLLGTVLLLATVVGIFTDLYLPEQLNADIASAKIFSLSWTFFFGLLPIIFCKKKNYLAVFVTYIAAMAFISAFGTKKFFEIDYKFGQNDLIKFAEIAKEKKTALTTFQFGNKFSLLFYGEIPVIYEPLVSAKEFKKALKRKNNFVIIEKKKLKNYKFKKFVIIDEGRKYLLIDEGK